MPRDIGDDVERDVRAAAEAHGGASDRLDPGTRFWTEQHGKGGAEAEPIPEATGEDLRQRRHEEKLRLREHGEAPEDVDAREAAERERMGLGPDDPLPYELEVELDIRRARSSAARDAQDDLDEASHPDLTPERIAQMHAVETGLRNEATRAETIVGLAQLKGIDVGRAYIDVATVVQGIGALDEHGQRLALYRLFQDSGLFKYMARHQSAHAAIGKAQRRLLGFDMNAAAAAVAGGRAVDVGDGDLQLDHAHLLTRKDKAGSYQADLDADVAAAAEAVGAARPRDELGRFKSREAADPDPEADVRRAAEAAEARRGAPTRAQLREVARSRGGTLAKAMSTYASFDAALDHPELATAALTFAWVRSGGTLPGLMHALAGAGGYEAAAGRAQQAAQRGRLQHAMGGGQGQSAADFHAVVANIARQIPAFDDAMAGKIADLVRRGELRRTGNLHNDLIRGIDVVQRREREASSRSRRASRSLTPGASYAGAEAARPRGGSVEDDARRAYDSLAGRL